MPMIKRRLIIQRRGMFTNKKLLLGVGVVVLVLIVGGVVLVKKHNTQKSQGQQTADFHNQTTYTNQLPPDKDTSKLPAGNYDNAAALQLTGGGGQCSGVGSKTIIPPMKLDQIGSIQPYGL